MNKRYKNLYIFFLIFIILIILITLYNRYQNFEHFVIKNKGPQIIDGVWCEDEECDDNSMKNLRDKYKKANNSCNKKEEYQKEIKEREKKFSNINTGEIGEQGSCLTNRNGKLYWGRKLQNMGDLCYVSSIDGPLHKPKPKSKPQKVKKQPNMNDILNQLKKDGYIKTECIPESELPAFKKQLFKENPKCSESYYIKKCEPGLVKLVCDDNYYYGLERGDGKSFGCTPITSNFDFECQKVNFSKYYNNKEITNKGCNAGYVRGTCSSIYKDKIKFGNIVSDCMNYDPSNDPNTEMNKFITQKCGLNLNSKCYDDYENDNECGEGNKLSKCYVKTTTNCAPNFGRVICYN